jgi:hypothetical protein
VRVVPSGSKPHRLEGIKAIVVMLANDASVAEGEKDSEVRPHFRAFSQGADRHRQGSDPKHFKRNAIGGGESGVHFVALGADSLAAAFTGLNDGVEVASPAVGKKSVWVYDLDDVGGEEPEQIGGGIRRRGGFDRSEVLSREFEIGAFGARWESEAERDRRIGSGPANHRALSLE